MGQPISVFGDAMMPTTSYTWLAIDTVSPTTVNGHFKIGGARALTSGDTGKYITPPNASVTVPLAPITTTVSHFKINGNPVLVSGITPHKSLISPATTQMITGANTHFNISS